jgi:hypothetical protein
MASGQKIARVHEFSKLRGVSADIGVMATSGLPERRFDLVVRGAGRKAEQA